MGFRNPVTTASAVDTRAGSAAPGARVYTRPIPGRSDGAVQGVLEFDDGVTGDLPATLDSHPGSVRSDTIGGTTTLTGGTFAASPGTIRLPNLILDALPAGAADVAGIPFPAGAPAVRRAQITGADVLIVPTGTQVQADGVPIVCASRAARDALTWTKGGLCARTDLGGLLQRYDGAAWRFYLAGSVSGTTDVNGLLTFPHSGDGQAPIAWGMTPRNQTTDLLNQVINLLAWSADATNLQLRATRTDSTAYLSSNPVSAYWWAQF